MFSHGISSGLITKYFISLMYYAVCTEYPSNQLLNICVFNIFQSVCRKVLVIKIKKVYFSESVKPPLDNVKWDFSRINIKIESIPII